MSSIEERLDRIERMVVLSGKQVLTVAECALWLNKSESRIRHMISERTIPYYKIGSRTMFKKSDVEAALLQNRVPSIDEVNAQAATYVAINNKKISTQ